MKTNSNISCIVERIFNDFTIRRTAIINALTNDADKFHLLCDPEKDGLCLFGHSNGRWEVSPPVIKIPTGIPDPAFGINFVRDGMERQEWISFVATHSDCWLLAVAFFNGAKLERKQREKLFLLINDLETVLEVVTDNNKLAKGTKISESNEKRAHANHVEEKGGDDNGTLCKHCGTNDDRDMFWIACDYCDEWFHGKCVKISLAQAEYIKKYKCSSCKMKRGRK